MISSLAHVIALQIMFFNLGMNDDGRQLVCTIHYSRSIGTMNSTRSSGCAPGGATAPPICKSRQCSGPLAPLGARTTRLLDLSTRTSKKLWKKGARLKSKRPDNASTLKGQALNHLIQYQNGCFHTGISASILARS